MPESVYLFFELLQFLFNFADVLFVFGPLLIFYKLVFAQIARTGSAGTLVNPSFKLTD